MLDDLQRQIIAKLSEYGQQGCSVNELFRKLRCSKNDFVEAKNDLIKNGIIAATKEGKQKINLSLNQAYFRKFDASFHYKLKQHEITAYEALKRLRKLKPLFEHFDDKGELPNITNQNVVGLLGTITGVLEAISHHTMAYTVRYHIDPDVRKTDIKENQRLGFDAIQNIIEKLIEQHKDEEKELRNYLLWSTTSSFSYVF